ncbi:MAG: hypothetical protein K2M94_04940 [Paramuribaculum sp.]|nr:hypothetical protein [Paramuribaculum sp.]
MRILLIYGVMNAGKTTACHLLFNDLKAIGATCSQCDGIDGRSFMQGDDFKALLMFRNKIVGIYSAGDGKDYVAAAIDFGLQNKCDYLVATVRKGIHYSASLNRRAPGDTCEWFELAKGNSPAEMTQYEAKIISSIIDNIK